MDKAEFVELVKLHTSAYDVKVKLHKLTNIFCDGVRVSGFFSESGKLDVAAKNRSWFGIFVHEYGHFRQWIEYCPVWKHYDRTVKKWDDWVARKVDMSKERIQIEFKAVRDLELDCEKRAVEMMKQFNLPIDIKEYIKGANAYIFFHAYVQKNRQWCDKKSPYKVQAILDLMPTKFLKNHEYNKMPPGFEELITKHCVKRAKKAKKK